MMILTLAHWFDIILIDSLWSKIKRMKSHSVLEPIKRMWILHGHQIMFTLHFLIIFPTFPFHFARVLVESFLHFGFFLLLLFGRWLFLCNSVLQNAFHFRQRVEHLVAITGSLIVCVFLQHFRSFVQFHIDDFGSVIPSFEHQRMSFFAFVDCVLHTSQHICCDEPYLIHQMLLLLEMVLKGNHSLFLLPTIIFQSVVIYLLSFAHNTFEVITDFSCQFLRKKLINWKLHFLCDTFPAFFKSAFNDFFLVF